MIKSMNSIPPSELWIGLHISTHCNFACPYCYVREYKDVPASLTKLGLESIFAKIKECQHPVHLHILGGEPTIAHLFDYTIELSLANDNIKSTTVFTNGSRRLRNIKGVDYVVSIHPDFFKPIHIKNFKDIENLNVRLLMAPSCLSKAKKCLEILRAAGIEPRPEYIVLGTRFEIGEIIDDFELKPTHIFDGKMTPAREVIEYFLKPNVKFKCIPNELYVKPNGDMGMLCRNDVTNDPNYIANVKIRPQQCTNKQGCTCIDTIKF